MVCGLFFVPSQSGEERRGEENCRVLCGEQCWYDAGCHVWTDLVIRAVLGRMGICGQSIDVTEMIWS
jgi:hypothetical protein